MCQVTCLNRHTWSAECFPPAIIASSMKPKRIKHWIVVLERIKTEFIWTPYDRFPTTEKISELIKEMKQAVEETERTGHPMRYNPNRTAEPKG